MWAILDPEDRQGGTTLRLLAEWIDARHDVHGAARNTSLWVSMKGAPLNRESLRRLLCRICEAAGLEGNRPPHAFRRASFTEGYLASPSSIRILAARMGWSPKSHHMIDTYTRGVEIELARTTPVASVSARWRGGSVTPVNLRAFPTDGGGPGRDKDNDPAPASCERADRERGRVVSPRKDRRLGS